MIEFVLALAIILSFIAIVVVASVYVTKNKIYSSNDKKEFTKIDDDKEEVDRLSNYGYKPKNKDSLLQKYRFCMQTVTTTEIREATIAKYPKLKDMDFQYVFNKILYYSRKTDIDLKYNKVGKTFFYTIWNIFDMHKVLIDTKNKSNYNVGLYSHKNLLLIVHLAKDIIDKKIADISNEGNDCYIN